jgi:hypothetical protein
MLGTGGLSESGPRRVDALAAQKFVRASKDICGSPTGTKDVAIWTINPAHSVTISTNLYISSFSHSGRPVSPRIRRSISSA